MHAQEEPLKPGEGGLPPELQAMEAALAALVPRADRLDVDQLLYEAGRQAARQAERRRRWSLAAVSSALSSLAATLVTACLLRPAPLVVQQPIDPTTPPLTTMLAHRTGPAVAEGVSPPVPRVYLETRDKVLAKGLDAWPSPASTFRAAEIEPREPVTNRDLREQWLRSAFGT